MRDLVPRPAKLALVTLNVAANADSYPVLWIKHSAEKAIHSFNMMGMKIVSVTTVLTGMAVPLLHCLRPRRNRGVLTNNLIQVLDVCTPTNARAFTTAILSTLSSVSTDGRRLITANDTGEDSVRESFSLRYAVAI